MTWQASSSRSLPQHVRLAAADAQGGVEGARGDVHDEAFLIAGDPRLGAVAGPALAHHGVVAAAQGGVDQLDVARADVQVSGHPLDVVRRAGRELVHVAPSHGVALQVGALHVESS
jgi:hypothetical protein